MPVDRQLSFAAALGLWAALGLAAAFYGAWAGYGGRALAVTLGVFAVLLAGEILVAARGVPEHLRGWFSPRSALLLAALPLLAYLIYALGTNTFQGSRAGLAIIYVLLPALLLSTARGAAPGAWQDYVAAAALAVPVNLYWVRNLWTYGDYRMAYSLGVLLALNASLAAFLFVRRLDGTGYTIAWGRGAGPAVLVNLLLVVAVGIPLGRAIGFLHWNPNYGGLKTIPLHALAILVFTAWPEEFLFRGVIQNLLTRTLGSTGAGLFAAAVIFGLAHLTNGVFPNWRFAVVATVAGIFYGRAWQRTGSITAAALVHTLTNVILRLFFRTF